MVESIEITQLGRTLLENTPAELRETVLKGACRPLYNALKRVQHKPGTIKRYDIDTAVLLVKEITDPHILSQIARSDTRAGIQGALRRHTTKFEITSTKRNGTVRTTTLLLQNDTDDILKQLWAGEQEYDWYQVLDWLRTLTKDEKSRVYQKLALTHTPIRTMLLADIHRGDVPGVDIHTLLADERIRDSWARKRLVTELLSSWNGAVDGTLAELIVEHNVNVRSNSKYTREAALTLAKSSNNGHHQAAMQSGQLTPTEAIELFDQAHGNLKGALLNGAPSEEIAEACALRLQYDPNNRGYGRNDPTGALERWANLSTDARLNVLRYGSPGEIAQFLLGRQAAKPRRGEATQLVRTLKEGNSYSDESDVAAALNHDGDLANPTVQEYWTEAYRSSTQLAQQLLVRRRSGILTEAVIAELAAHLGDDTAAWEMLATLLPEWGSTIPELIKTIEMMTG